MTAMPNRTIAPSARLPIEPIEREPIMSQITSEAPHLPRLAIFADFDGTLVELSDSPDAAKLSEELTAQLGKTAEEFGSAFALLTSRDIEDIDKYLAPLHLPVAGAHGTQRRRADGFIETTEVEAVDKGAALRAFMQEEPFIGRTPIVIGDGDNDEAAFIAAQEMGGVGIKLGDGETAARMRIHSVASVHALLRGLSDLSAGRPDQTEH
jgi:trehalose-6-phosphatase